MPAGMRAVQAGRPSGPSKRAVQAGRQRHERWRLLSTARSRALLATARDVLIVQRAAPLIEDLGADLDRQLQLERRPAERLRLLRETTNRITRTANDAVHAYQRASRAVAAELAKPNGNLAGAQETRRKLSAGRAEVLRVLERAQRHYPATEPGAGRTGSPR